MSSGFGRSLPVNSLNGSSSSVSFKQSQNIPPGSASRANLAPPATNSVSLQGGLSAASTTSFSSSFSGGSSLSSSSTSLSASAVLSSSALGSLRNSSQNPLAERPASTGNAMPAFKIPKLKVQSNTATNSQISQAQTVPASSASSLLLQGASSSQRSIATNLSRSSVTTSITAMTAKVNNELTSSSVFSTSRLEPTQSTFQITSSSFSSSSFSTASSSTSLSLAPIRSQQQQQHQSYTKSNFGSAQPSFVIAEDEDGALSTTTSPIQSFSFSSSFVPSSSTLSSASSSDSSSEATSAVDDVPLQLSELNNVAYTSASSAPPPPPPPSSSSLSAAIIDTVPPMTTISKSSSSFLPAFQLPTRTQIKTGSSASASATALSNNSASIKPRGRRKSGANTAILSVTDPIGVADILDHPALPVSDSEDDEQELRLTASKKRKASSSSSSTVLALNTSEVDSSSAAIVSIAIDHHSMIIDPQPSTSSRSRQKSSSSSASTVGSGSGMTGTNEVLPLTTTSEATGGSRKRTRGSQKQSTPTTLVNETTFNVSRDDVSISLSSSSTTLQSVEPISSIIVSSSTMTTRDANQQQTLPALARLFKSTSSNTAAEAAANSNNSSSLISSTLGQPSIGAVPPPLRAMSSSSSSSSSSQPYMYKVRRGGCGTNLLSTVYESDTAFSLRLGHHVASILEGVAEFVSTKCSMSSTLPQFLDKLTALSEEWESSGTSIGAAFSIPLHLFATAMAANIIAVTTGEESAVQLSNPTFIDRQTQKSKHFGSASSSMVQSTLSNYGITSTSSSSSMSSSVIHEIEALKDFVNSLIAAEKLCSPEITTINERNMQRNDYLNTGREEKVDAFLLRTISDEIHPTERPALSSAYLSQQSQSMDEDDAYTGSASNSPIQFGSISDGKESCSFGSNLTSQRALHPTPPPCTPLRQVLSTNIATTSGESLTPERTHRKNHTVRFSSFDFSAVNAAPAELTSGAIPAPFSSRRSPRSIALGGSAADEKLDGKGMIKRDIIESGCLVFSLTEVVTSGKKLRDVLHQHHHLPASSSSSSSSSHFEYKKGNNTFDGGHNRDEDKRLITLGSQSFDTLNFDAEIRLLTLPHAAASLKEKNEQQSAASTRTQTNNNMRSYVSLTAPIMQIMCALSVCSSGTKWESVISKAFEKCHSSSSTPSSSSLPLFLRNYHHPNNCDISWSTIRGAARFHAKELSLLRSELFDLPLASSLSNALSSSARYHLRRALNPHVYDDDGEAIVTTGVRPFDPTSTPPPPSTSTSTASQTTIMSSNQNPQKLLLLDGINHHHHHRPQVVIPVSKSVASTTNGLPPPLCGGFGRGAGGIEGGFLSMVHGSGNFKYNSDDLAAATHEALRSLYLSRERVEAIIAPHSLLLSDTDNENDWEDSSTPMAQPLSLIQIIDACSLSDLGCVYRFAESHSFLRALFGHEQAIAALSTDGEVWKKLRTLARIADEFDCESERHLLPLASISTTALTSLLQEGEIVDKLLSLSQLTLDRHVRGLEAARPKHKRSSTGSATSGGGGGGGGGSAPASPNSAAAASANHHQEDHCAGRNGLAARDAHDRPRKKRHAHSRLASPSPLDRQRFLELVVGSGGGSVEDDEEGHYPEPVPPMKLDLLMHAEADISSSSSSSSSMVDNDSIEGGNGGHGLASDMLNTSNGDTESSGGSISSGNIAFSSQSALASIHGVGGCGISSRFALLGSDAAAARAQSLLDHEDVIDKKLRFVFPRIKFFRCSADARDVFDDETTQNHANLRGGGGGGGGGGGLSSSTSSFLSGLGGSLINNNSSSYLQASSSTQHAQKSESSVVNLNFRLSAPPVVVKTSVTAASVTSGSAGGGGGGGGGRSSDSSGPPPSLTLDDLMADVMRYPGGGSTTAGTVSQDSSPLAHCSVNGSSSSMLSASTTAGLPLGGPLQLFSSFQGGGFAPSPFSAAFSTLSLLAPPSSSLSQNNILMESSVLMTNESSISTDCGECKRSLALTPIAIVDAQWGAGASPGAKRRDKQAQSLSLYGSSSSKGGGGEIITVKCGKCKVSFHAECVGLSVALDRWNCQSCMWR